MEMRHFCHRQAIEVIQGTCSTCVDAGNDLVAKCVDIASQACVLLLDMLLGHEDVVDNMLQFLNVVRRSGLDLGGFWVLCCLEKIVPFV